MERAREYLGCGLTIAIIGVAFALGLIRSLEGLVGFAVIAYAVVIVLGGIQDLIRRH